MVMVGIRKDVYQFCIAKFGKDSRVIGSKRGLGNFYDVHGFVRLVRRRADGKVEYLITDGKAPEFVFWCPEDKVRRWRICNRCGDFHG